MNMTRCDRCGGSVLYDGDLTCMLCGHIVEYGQIRNQPVVQPYERKGPNKIGAGWKERRALQDAE